VQDSSFEVSYDNSKVQACAFFLPMINTADGSPASAFGIRPFDMDGWVPFVTLGPPMSLSITCHILCNCFLNSLLTRLTSQNKYCKSLTLSLPLNSPSLVPVRYSFISIYSNTSAPPIQTISANNLFVLDAAAFATYGGITMIINVAGTFTPFSVVVTVAASCLPPYLPVGFISSTDALLGGGVQSLGFRPPLAYCINTSSFLPDANSSDVQFR
jgi:hypothetical protein